jgi:isoprenylcysteine carboxyl methyltransferase (ICMT) family protein YpbQ
VCIDILVRPSWYGMHTFSFVGARSMSVRASNTGTCNGVIFPLLMHWHVIRALPGLWCVNIMVVSPLSGFICVCSATFLYVEICCRGG